MKCSNCKEEYRSNEMGSKRLPKPLCHDCVIKLNIFTCTNCKSSGCVQDEFFLTSCFECKQEGCIKCIPHQEMCRDMSFDFCEEHKNCDKKEMRDTADEIIEEEKALFGDEFCVEPALGGKNE